MELLRFHWRKLSGGRFSDLPRITLSVIEKSDNLRSRLMVLYSVMLCKALSLSESGTKVTSGVGIRLSILPTPLLNLCGKEYLPALKATKGQICGQ